jgi:hypothetical protein
LLLPSTVSFYPEEAPCIPLRGRLEPLFTGVRRKK